MLKSIGIAFLVVFLAELGDKTQLSTMLLASKSSSIWYTFIGSALALVLSSFLGVIAGSFLSKWVPPPYMQYISGFIFLVIGVLLLSGKF